MSIHDGEAGRVSVEFDGVCTLVTSNNNTNAEVRLLALDGHEPTLLVPRKPRTAGSPDSVVVVDDRECGVWSLKDCDVSVNSTAPLSLDLGDGWTSLRRLLQLQDSGRPIVTGVAAPRTWATVRTNVGKICAVEPDQMNKARQFRFEGVSIALSQLRVFACRILWSLPVPQDSTLDVVLSYRNGTVKQVSIQSGSVARLTNLCFQPGGADVVEHFRVVGIDPASVSLVDEYGQNATVWPYDITCSPAAYLS